MIKHSKKLIIRQPRWTTRLYDYGAYGVLYLIAVCYELTKFRINVSLTAMIAGDDLRRSFWLHHRLSFSHIFVCLIICYSRPSL